MYFMINSQVQIPIFILMFIDLSDTWVNFICVKDIETYVSILLFSESCLQNPNGKLVFLSDTEYSSVTT